jgi:hypothetical protein
MFKYHAIMINEIGGEFSVTVESNSIDSAIEYLDNSYPESSVADIGDSEYWRQLEIQRFNRLESEWY